MNAKMILLNEIATLSECIEGVDVKTVGRYWFDLRQNNPIESIKLRPKNAQGFYVIDDGNHRTRSRICSMAASLSPLRLIRAPRQHRLAGAGRASLRCNTPTNLSACRRIVSARSGGTA